MNSNIIDSTILVTCDAIKYLLIVVTFVIVIRKLIKPTKKTSWKERYFELGRNLKRERILKENAVPKRSYSKKTEKKIGICELQIALHTINSSLCMILNYDWSRICHCCPNSLSNFEYLKIPNLDYGFKSKEFDTVHTFCSQ